MKCIKSLWKSTYQGLAFTAGQDYRVLNTVNEEKYIIIFDNEGQCFSFSRVAKFGFYFIDEYFEK